MTPLAVIPDAEALVTSHLNAHPDVLALDARVAGRTPNSMTRPWVRLTQLNAAKSPGSTPEHLLNALLQLDAYAGDTAMRDFRGQAEASLLARTVRAVLVAMPGQDFEDAVVTDAVVVSMPRIPDTDFEPARERFVITATIRLHAKPGA